MPCAPACGRAFAGWIPRTGGVVVFCLCFQLVEAGIGGLDWFGSGVKWGAHPATKPPFEMTKPHIPNLKFRAG